MSSSPLPLSLLMDKVARAAGQHYAALIADLDVRPRHVGLLTAVDRLESPSQAQLGAWLGVGPSAVVALVDELQERGAVTRESDPANRRRWTISLTAGGRDLLAAATEVAEGLDAEMLAGLSSAERTSLRKALEVAAGRVGVAG